MILDQSLQMSSAQAVTASAASTNVIDQGAAGDAVQSELYLVVQVRQAAAASGAATVNFVLQTSPDNSTWTTLFDSGAIGKAALTANAQPVRVPMPVGAQRYLQVQYNVGTGPLTAGAFDAFLADTVKV